MWGTGAQGGGGEGLYTEGRGCGGRVHREAGGGGGGGVGETGFGGEEMIGGERRQETHRGGVMEGGRGGGGGVMALGRLSEWMEAVVIGKESPLLVSVCKYHPQTFWTFAQS